MARYIPPHKRHSKDSTTPSPSPSPFPSEGTVYRWIVAPDDQDAQLPSSIRLQEFSCESIERQDGQKPMILVCDRAQEEELNEKGISFDKSPWESIVQKIQEDLLTSFQVARSDMSKYVDQTLPRFLIRFGKILFHNYTPSINLDNINNTSDVEYLLGKYKKGFYTNVPTSFVDAVLGDYVPRIGLDFVEEKEFYFVWVCDKSRQRSFLCKCRVTDTVGELDIYKIFCEQRLLIADISCLDKNLDLRLYLSSRRYLTSLTEETYDSLSNIVKSAVIDSEVKGGLRWPLGKESFGDRYTVVEIWRIKDKSFSNSSMRLKVRHVDRFDFRTSTGEAALEANLRVPELTKLLRDENADLNPLIDLVCDTLKVIWGHFLQWEGSLT